MDGAGVESAQPADDDIFRAAMDASPDMIWMARVDGTLVWCNERVQTVTGMAPSDVRGRAWFDLLAAGDRARVADAWTRAISAGDPFDAECELPDAAGTVRRHMVRARLIGASVDRAACWIVSCTDIEDHKAVADALARDNEQLEQDMFTQLHVVKRTRSRLQTYFDACPDYLYLMRLSKDEGLTYEDLNPAALAFHRCDRAVLLGRSPASVLGAEEAMHVESQVKRCLQGGGAINYLAEHRRDAGKSDFIEFVGAPLEYSNEEEGLVLLCGRDITEQRGIEEALRQSQKMEAVGQLTGGLAHDFNNLLTGITGCLDLIRMRMSQGRFDSVDRYMTAAQSAASRAASLTHRLLAFSRRQTLDPKPIDANQLVLGMEDLLKRTVGPEIFVDIDLSDGPWTVLVDPSQLENALLNLCINARDAMPDGGRLSIATKNASLAHGPAGDRDRPVGDFVVLAVTDTGAGMTPEVVARIFDPFFTTKPLGQGTGLGLSMIYGFARQSGGEVRVRSSVGVGTTMRIFLPRHDAAPERIDAAADVAASPGAGKSELILVVDDEPTIRVLVSEVLQDLGYNVLEAVDGPSGLKHLQSDEAITLLVTDVGLPGGMNGRQLAEAGRTLRPDLRVLFITGYAENAVLNHGHLDAGMQVLIKPFTMDVLTRRIETLLQESSP